MPTQPDRPPDPDPGLLAGLVLGAIAVLALHGLLRSLGLP